jgi:cation diffusion facilitator family transporter
VKLSIASSNVGLQRLIAFAGLALFCVKLGAWLVTGSVAILTDALESVVNVISAFIGLYSLRLSALPRDRNHPYGHGKVEFVSAGVEGALITLAGLAIIVEGVRNLWQPHVLQRLDLGMLLVLLSAAVNYGLGVWADARGRRTRSLALQASGAHLKTDTWSTLALVAGLLVIRFTGLVWLDSLVAIGFSLYIIYTGYRIVRRALAGIMDETDEQLISEVVGYIAAHRSRHWIDLHNLRIIRYGSVLHLDCHLTVPWYFNVHQAHDEVDKLSQRVRQQFGESVELFVHTDGCLDYSCAVCSIEDCAVRQHPFVRRVAWTEDTVMQNTKHRLGAAE